jgi:hypothetical protein
MADVIYNRFKRALLDRVSGSGVDFDTDTLKVALVTSAYTPDIDAHNFYSDLTNEVTGTGYSAGGSTLTTPTVTQDNTNDWAYFDADDVTWAASTITARGAVLYKSTGVAGTSLLIAYFDFGSDKSSTAGNFTIQWNASGIVRLA